MVLFWQLEARLAAVEGRIALLESLLARLWRSFLSLLQIRRCHWCKAQEGSGSAGSADLPPEPPPPPERMCFHFLKYECGFCS